MAESRRGLMMFRPFLKKLRKGFSTSAYSASPALNHSKFNEDMSVGKAVPGDVKEGFFTVFTVTGKERNSGFVNFLVYWIKLGKNMDSSRKGLFHSLVDLMNCGRLYNSNTAKEATMLALKVGDTCKANILES